MKRWKVTAELNMDASHYESMVVEANTKRKARLFAEKAFKENGNFYVTNITVKLLSDK